MIKLLEGTQGIGVILAPDIKVAEAIIETLQSTRQNVLIQRFVSESKGRDIRALVVGDRVVAAMRRVAKGDEFRSNVHRGGSVEPVELDPAFEEAAVRSAQIMGLRVAGVDMLEGNDGPLVMEVNSSPGLEGIEAATKLDVAGAIIDHIDNQVAFPQIDVRQRLSVSTGYGVAELLVHGDADIVGLTLGDSGLRERDISVLTLHRGTSVIPNPRASHRARVRRPAAVLRQARGDALDDPGPPQAQPQGQEAAEGADPRAGAASLRGRGGCRQPMTATAHHLRARPALLVRRRGRPPSGRPVRHRVQLVGAAPAWPTRAVEPVARTARCLVDRAQDRGREVGGGQGQGRRVQRESGRPPGRVDAHVHASLAGVRFAVQRGELVLDLGDDRAGARSASSRMSSSQCSEVVSVMTQAFPASGPTNHRDAPPVDNRATIEA